MPRTLLLADDSVTIQKVVQIVFAAEDTQVVAVDNGEDALQKAREIQPDIIVADIVMPRRNGYDLAQAIKSDGALRHIPVLLLTSTFEPYDEGKASAAQADGYLVKPFDSQALIDKVNELLGGRPAVAAAAPARVAAPSTQVPWPAPAAPLAQPFRPSAPASAPAPGHIRPPAPIHPPAAMPRAPLAPPTVPSLSPVPGMRPVAPAPPGMPAFSVSRPAVPASPTPPPTLSASPSRPAPPAPSFVRPDPFAGLPPSGAPRPPVRAPSAPLPFTVAAPMRPPVPQPAAQIPQPAAPSRPAPWPGQPVPPQRPVAAAPSAPAPTRATPLGLSPPSAPAPAPAARPAMTGWDTLGPSFEDEVAPPQTLGAAYMAEAAAAATMNDSPGDLALDVPLEDEVPETVAPLQTARSGIGFDLGESQESSLELGQPFALHGGTLADLSQPLPSRQPDGIELSEEDGNADDRLELAAPHEFLGGPTPPPSAPARPKAPVAAPPSPTPLRAAAASGAASGGDASEAALRAALSSASREVIERVVWEVVPQMVEVIVREHVERLAQAREK
jgi:CheY-like chemotaxis protein